jgi:hypothetical protein
MFVPLECRNRFRDYVLHVDKAFSSSHLADYAHQWIAYDDGARECGNDYGVFLGALILSQRLYESAPSLYFPDGNSQPVAFLDESCRECQSVFDPTFFAWMAADPQRLNRDYAKDVAEDEVRMATGPEIQLDS